MTFLCIHLLLQIVLQLLIVHQLLLKNLHLLLLKNPDMLLLKNTHHQDILILESTPSFPNLYIRLTRQLFPTLLGRYIVSLNQHPTKRSSLILFGKMSWLRNLQHFIKHRHMIRFHYHLENTQMVFIGYIRSKTSVMGPLNNTKLELLEKDTHKNMVWIMRRLCL